jgi:SAM-dependent methyltransferase
MNQPKWDDRYNKDHYIFGTDPNAFLAEFYQHIPKGDVLCLADGEGRNSVFLAKQGYQVTAVDASLVGIEKAKSLAQQNRVYVNFIHADLAEFDMGDSIWDGIVSIFCHLPVSLRQKVHGGAVKGLRKEGVFLLEAYTPKQLEYATGGPPKAELLMTSETLTRELSGLNFNHLVELERDVQEGTDHAGLASVVQLVGKK